MFNPDQAKMTFMVVQARLISAIQIVCHSSGWTFLHESRAACLSNFSVALSRAYLTSMQSAGPVM